MFPAAPVTAIRIGSFTASTPGGFSFATPGPGRAGSTPPRLVEGAGQGDAARAVDEIARGAQGRRGVEVDGEVRVRIDVVVRRRPEEFGVDAVLGDGVEDPVVGGVQGRERHGAR